jgi:stage II sporulation protein AA (anti-sigma F factor antagonist)
MGGYLMYVEFENNADKLIVTLTGELDHHSAEEVRIKIDDRIDRASINKVIMDFAHVNFMDSSGIGVIIGRYKKLSMKRGTICIANANGSVERIFQLSGLFKIIKSYKTLGEALSII